MRQRIGFMLALTTFLSTGCYHQVVHTGATPAPGNAVIQKTAALFFFGLKGAEVDTVADCPDRGCGDRDPTNVPERTGWRIYVGHLYPAVGHDHVRGGWRPCAGRRGSDHRPWCEYGGSGGCGPEGRHTRETQRRAGGSSPSALKVSSS